MTSRLELGLARFRAKAFEPAAQEFLEAVKETPGDGSVWSLYGIALAHLGRASEAETALARAVALAPGNGDAWFHLGVARALQNEWTDAAAAYRRAVALAPEDVVAWHRLGVALAESGDERGASSAFERALVLSREVPGDEAEGGEGPTEALHDGPNEVDDRSEEAGDREGTREAKSWLDLALSLLSLGDEEEAVAAYERAYTLDPERARHSLFPPMLRLLTAVEGEATPDEGPGRGPRGGPRPPEPRRDRPEIP